MQIICGQCGQQYEFDEHPPEDVIKCSKCGHSIFLKVRPDKSEFDEGSDSGGDGADLGFAKMAQQILARRMIIFCSKCGEQMKIQKRLAGRTIRCRFCSQILRVPFLDEDDQTGADKPGEMPDPYQAVHDLQRAIGSGWKKAIWAKKKSLTNRPIFWFLLIASTVIGLMTVVRYRPQIRNYVKSLVDRSSESQPGSPADITQLAPLSAKPSVRFVAADWTVFAHKGYVPSKPDHWYCNLTVEMQAGEKPLIFANIGSGVTLRNSKKSFPSLGESILAGHNFTPIRARRRVIKMKPHARQSITLLFELPDSVRDVSLHIGSLDPQAIILPSPPSASQLLTGEYVEVEPRNCRPLLRDPIMAAIQAISPQTLDISHRNGVLRVAITPTNISGEGRFLDENLYELTLLDGDDRLVCKLRQIDNARVVLYLSDEPMHQITFRRKVVLEPEAGLGSRGQK